MTNPFVQFEEDIVAFAKSEIAKAEAVGEKIFATIEPIAVNDLEALWNSTKNLAVEVVVMFAKQEFAALTGIEKQAQVVANVLQFAKSQGIAATSAMAQTVAQQAYTVVANNLTAQQASATGVQQGN